MSPRVLLVDTPVEEWCHVPVSVATLAAWAARADWVAARAATG